MHTVGGSGGREGAEVRDAGGEGGSELAGLGAEAVYTLPWWVCAHPC